MVMVDDVPVRRAPNFLIVHGGWQDSWWWRPVATYLAQLGYRCWTPDLPGCAPGDPNVATVTVRRMADSVLDRIRSTPQMRDLILVVHSGGGPVGQLVAAAVPERIAALVFVDAWVLTGQECIADLLPPSFAPVVDLARRGDPIPMDPAVWFSAFAQDATEAARAEGGARVAATLCPPDWVTAVLDWRPFWNLVADRSFATCYLYLTEDRAVPTELYRRMARRCRPVATRSTPGSHQGFHRYPCEFAQTLLDALTTGQTQTGTS
jgi:pimeloyl-ACP methyl ester carboxylesterase